LRNKKLVAIALLPVFLVLACASAERTAYRVAGTTAVSVDTAMKSWADWVVFNKRAGTPVPDSQEAEVRKGYARYQLESGRAEKVVQSYLAAKKAQGSADPIAVKAATEAVRVAATELVHLVFRLKGEAAPAKVSLRTFDVQTGEWAYEAY